MTAVAMCPGQGCKVRNECYRYRATPWEQQAWGSFDEITCGHMCLAKLDLGGTGNLMPEDWQEPEP